MSGVEDPNGPLEGFLVKTRAGVPVGVISIIENKIYLRGFDITKVSQTISNVCANATRDRRI